jgi:hypothetical protein
VDAVFCPYQLDPAEPASAVPLLHYLGQRFGGSAASMTKSVSAAAAGEGLTIDWPRARAVCTPIARRGRAAKRWTLRAAAAFDRFRRSSSTGNTR